MFEKRQPPRVPLLLDVLWERDPPANTKRAYPGRNIEGLSVLYDVVIYTTRRLCYLLSISPTRKVNRHDYS